MNRVKTSTLANYILAAPVGALMYVIHPLVLAVVTSYLFIVYFVRWWYGNDEG